MFTDNQFDPSWFFVETTAVEDAAVEIAVPALGVARPAREPGPPLFLVEVSPVAEERKDFDGGEEGPTSFAASRAAGSSRRRGLERLGKEPFCCNI